MVIILDYCNFKQKEWLFSPCYVQSLHGFMDKIGVNPARSALGFGLALYGNLLLCLTSSKLCSWLLQLLSVLIFSTPFLSLWLICFDSLIAR
jgi:hypothetical protein